MPIPHIRDLHSESDLEQTRVLDLLFEPSPAIHDTLLPVIRTAQYTTYEELIDACQIRLLSLAAATPAFGTPDSRLLSALGSHPRLGEKKIESKQSIAEQANIGGHTEELAALNAEYEATFPGLRYVVYVNGRDRTEILDDMRHRIERQDYTKEVDEALQAMCDIAKDRVSKLDICPDSRSF